VFGKLKEHIAGEKFGGDGEAKVEVLRWLKEQRAELAAGASSSSSPDSRNALTNMATTWNHKQMYVLNAS
jgi:hypothetical protein